MGTGKSGRTGQVPGGRQSESLFQPQKPRVQRPLVQRPPDVAHRPGRPGSRPVIPGSDRESCPGCSVIPAAGRPVIPGSDQESGPGPHAGRHAGRQSRRRPSVLTGSRLDSGNALQGRFLVNVAMKSAFFLKNGAALTNRTRRTMISCRGGKARILGEFFVYL